MTEARALPLPKEGPRIWRREKIEIYVRQVRKQATTSRHVALGAAAELTTYGGSFGALTLTSRVIDGGKTWVSRVDAQKETAAVAAARALGDVLGLDGWQIEKDGGSFILTKSL